MAPSRQADTAPHDQQTNSTKASGLRTVRPRTASTKIDTSPPTAYRLAELPPRPNAMHTWSRQIIAVPKTVATRKAPTNSGEWVTADAPVPSPAVTATYPPPTTSAATARMVKAV